MSQQDKYIITRIIGNELPPRDTCGGRMEILRFILLNEHLEPGTSRLWLINRILDTDYLRDVRSILDAAGERYVEELVDWPAYTKASSRAESLRILININGARNRCFTEGRKLAELVFVLDGDCYFDKPAWLDCLQLIAADQHIYDFRKYYAVPICRVGLDLLPPAGENGAKLEEPNLAFRFDATLTFDESIPFGQDDKQDLLRRLQLARTKEAWSAKEPGGPCAVVGCVLHLQTGLDQVENNVYFRMNQRKKSLDLLLERADRHAEQLLLSAGQLLPLILFKMRRCRIAFRS